MFVTQTWTALLTALYVEIDDHVILRPARAGPAEEARRCRAGLPGGGQVLLGARSEHHWLRMCYARLGHLFPTCRKQPGYHKRLKAAAPLLAAAMDHLARAVRRRGRPVRLIDATPVPCGTSRETVKRSELAGWAATGTARRIRAGTGA